MKNPILFVTLYLTGIALHGQSYQVGTSDYSFFDSDRDRDIPSLIFYPATAEGENTPVAGSEFGFPVVSFGHGFVIEPGAYVWLGEVLASNGYIMVLPATEGQLLPAPDHLNFGRDIRFCAEEIIRLGSAQGNPLSGKVLPRYAMMGHSMGGGATYLGAEESGEVTTTITFAAADTDPSSISAAQGVNVPSLVIAAEEDCVTPVSSNQLPMYQNLPNGQKAFVNIENASHCNFTDGSASLCYLGEAFPCLFSGPFISRQDQHARILEVLMPWLDNYLRSECASGGSFLSVLEEGNMDGRWSSQVEGEPLLNCEETCSAPGGFNVEVSDQGFGLSWNGVEDALGYQIQARLNGSVAGSVNSFARSLAIDQLDNSLAYEFRVRAFCPEQGLSGYTDWKAAGSAVMELVNNGELVLRYKNAQAGTSISVHDFSGEPVRQEVVNESNGHLDLSSLPKGLYVAGMNTGKEIKYLKFAVL